MINRALKIIRLFHEIKQTDLANEFNISKSYLSEIESGKKTITFDLLEKYAQFFDIPVSSLVFFSEQIEKENPNTLPEKFKKFYADKVLKIMEWNIANNEEKKAKI